MLLCRMDRELPHDEKAKISLFCNISENAVIACYDVPSIYNVPRMLHDQQIDDIICSNLNINTHAANLSVWDNIANNLLHPLYTLDIAFVGKYVDLTESYKSLNEALIHAGIHTKTRVNIHYVDATDLENGDYSKVSKVDAILVPGGFGLRGVEGKIKAVQYARENKIPYLGICLGMQIAIIEFARNVANMKMANSTEFDEKANPAVIAMISQWQDNMGNIEKRNEHSDLGGTMRLGAQECKLQSGTLAHSIYKTDIINERHRHRFEVNNQYVADLVKQGLIISGISTGLEHLVEMIELQDHPWFVACQFHPEFNSNPKTGHPLFISFINAGLLKRNKKG